MTIDSAIAEDLTGYDLFVDNGRQYLITEKVSNTELKCDYISSWTAEEITASNTVDIMKACGFASHSQFLAPIVRIFPFERVHEGYFESNAGKKRMIGWRGDRLKAELYFPYLTEHFMEKILRCFYHPYSLRFYPQYGNLNDQGNEVFWNVLFPDEFDPQYFKRKYFGYSFTLELMAENLVDSLLSDIFEI
jgi:hypothetical protein